MSDPGDVLTSNHHIMYALNHVVCHNTIDTLSFVLTEFQNRKLSLVVSPFTVMYLIMITKHDSSAFEKLDMFIESKIIIKKNEWEVNDAVFRSNIKLIENKMCSSFEETTKNLTDHQLIPSAKKKLEDAQIPMNRDRNTGVQ